VVFKQRKGSSEFESNGWGLRIGNPQKFSWKILWGFKNIVQY
jgi:hypothetical protein